MKPEPLTFQLIRSDRAARDLRTIFHTARVLASAVLAFSVLGIGAVVAWLGVLVSAFTCSNACYSNSTHWWDHSDSGRWGTVAGLSVALFFLVLLFPVGIILGITVLRWMTLALALPTFVGQALVIFQLWVLASPTDRRDITQPFLWLTVALEVAAATSLFLALTVRPHPQRKLRAAEDQPK